MRRKIVSTMIILSFIIAITYLPSASSQTYFTLDLVTDPSEVETVDPEALTGEGLHESGTCVIIDAKQIVISGAVRYEFVQWSTTDDWPFDPEDEPELVGNQAFIMMDGDRTVTAIYEPHYLFYLDLETEPEEVEIADPEALTGEGYYESGTCVIIDAKQTIVSGNVRYEFAEWSTTDDWPFDPEDEPELVGNQAFIFMDGDRYVVAKYYEVPNTYTLTLEADPDPNVLDLDPDALQGAGVYDAGDTATISAEPYVYLSDTIRYEFYRWTSDDVPDPTGNPADVVMDGDYTVTAEYRLYYYLDAVTDPSEVQAADPDAVSGQGWYRSGTYGIVDAKQTVVSGLYSYEFTGWETEDQYYDDEGNPVTLPPNQAARFMDAPWTMVAQYETTIEEKWDIKLSGEFDYLEYENIKVAIAALITYSDTGSPVSNADVTIDIYDEEGKHMVSNVMVEKLAGTGIYQWKSPQTIRNLMLNKKIGKGIYMVHVQALSGEAPVASAVIMFHIDPPGEDPVSMTALVIAVIAVLASVMTPLILVKQGLIGFTKKSSS